MRHPAGDTNVVQHNTISPDNASPGHGGAPTAISLSRVGAAAPTTPAGFWAVASGVLALLTLVGVRRRLALRP